AVLHPGGVGRALLALDPLLAGDRVDGVDLDLLRLEQARQHAEHVEALALLRVAGGGGEEQHGRADVAPAREQDFLVLQALGAPAAGLRAPRRGLRRFSPAALT